MRRRAFLLAPIPVLALQPKIRIALLGAAHSHAFGKAQVLLENPSYELAGVHEPGPKLFARFERLGCKPLSMDQILHDPAILVVAIESDVKDHYQHARLALQAGKHIHVEKPPADTMDRARELASLARAKNLLLQSGYMWRYHPGINTAIDMAKRGWLGEVFMVRGQINTVVSPAQRLLLAAFKGGQMFELGGHLIDALVRLMGRPQKVTPFLRHDAALADTLADNTAAVFEFSRAMAIIQTATMQPGAGSHRSFEILGSNGTALVRPIEPPELRVDLAKPAGPYQSGPQTIPLPPYRRYVGDFIELAAALRGEKKLSMPLDAELLVQETLLRASAML